MGNGPGPVAHNVRLENFHIDGRWRSPLYGEAWAGPKNPMISGLAEVKHPDETTGILEKPSDLNFRNCQIVNFPRHRPI